MPAVRLSVPEGLLNAAVERGEQLGKDLDELYADALERYLNATMNASAGSLRSRFIIPRSSPQIVIEVAEDLCQRADEAAERLEKRRPILYADALAYHLARAGPAAANALDDGHDLPSGAWRAKE